MSKQKRNEIYSFKALSQPNNSEKALGDSIQSIEIQQEDELFTNNNNHPVKYENKIKSGVYRHEKMFHKSNFQPELKLYGDLDQIKSPPASNNHQPWRGQHMQHLHPKVISLDSQIEQNVKRRLALEQELNRLKRLQQQQNQHKTNQHSNQPYLVEREFALRNLQTDFIDQLIHKGDQLRVIKPRVLARSKEEQQKANFKRQRNEKIDKSVEILNDDHIGTILKNGFDEERNQTKGFYGLSDFMEIDSKQFACQKSKINKKPIKQAQTPTPPPITAIQSMLSRLTFPEVPKENVQKLLTKTLQLHAIYQSHSDIVYLLMVGSFHKGDFHGVRKYFKQILTFKKFQKNAYWVAAQAEYELGNQQRCIKLADYCMQNLSDKYLPRFLYLKARCYNQQGNFTNSIICYNQLIRIRPKIAEYYLQRAILYDKLGYVKQCRQDYLMFGILKPDAKSYLQEKIIIQSNDAKRKELLQIYKMIV